MKTNYLYSILSIILISMGTGMISCSNKQQTVSDSTAVMITDKIIYDVIIKSPEVDNEWWRNNIEPSGREKFINSLLDDVLSGKRNAFDYLSDTVLLSKTDINQIIGTKHDTVYVETPESPNDLKQVAVTTTFDRKTITRIRFLEKWKMTDKGIVKEVIGIAPLKEVYDKETGEIRGYTPLFWVFFNK